MIDLSRWLPGLTPDPEEEDPVTRTLRSLGQGVQDASTALGDIGRSAGQSVVGAVQGAATAVQDAYAVPVEERPPQYSGPSYAQPSLAPGQPSMLEQLPEVGQAGISAAQQTAVDRGALLIGGRPPETPEEIWSQAMPAPARAVQLVSEIGQAAGGAAGRRFAEGTVRPDEDVDAPLFTRPEIGPFPAADWTRGDVGQVAGSIVGDPTTYFGVGAAGRAADLPVEAALGVLGRGVKTGAGAVGRGARVGASRLGAVFGDAAPLADEAAAALGAPGVQHLGSGVVPEPDAARRMYHGTAEAFGRPDPAKFDRKGLYGPGYYLTDDPTIASSYADARNVTPGGITPKPTLRANRLADEIQSAEYQLSRNPSPEDRAWLESRIADARAEMDRVTSQGPNVRAVDVPEGLTLLDTRQPPDIARLRSISEAIPDPEARRQFDIRAFYSDEAASTPLRTNDEVYRVLENALDSKVEVNDVLRRAGYDGIAHEGGLNRALLDANGEPIRHEVTVVFPDALDKIRNAFSGEPGGSGVVPRLGAGLRADAFNAAQGGVFGAASEDLQAQQEGREADPAERARRALITGGLAVAGGRYARPAAAGAARLGAGVVPSIKATPDQVAAEVAKGPRRGAMLNRAVQVPSSTAPLSTRIAVEATDDRAGIRWAEDLMTDASGQPRMRENDPRRASTLSRENAASIGNERVRSELEPAIVSAGKAGLHNDLPEHLEDMQQRDILAEFYRRGQQEAADAGVTDPALLEEAGLRRMRTREGGSNDMTWEALDARLTAREQRLKASGQWDQLQDAAQQVWEHNATTRRRAHAAGEIDAETLAYYEETYPHYVPTVPLSHLDARGGPQASAGARVNRGTAPLTKALEDVGTSGERLNPLAASRSATLRAERSMQRNHTARAFAELYDEALQAAPGDLAAPAGKKSLLEGDTEFSYIENGEPVTIRVPKIVADGLEAAAASGADPGMMGRAQRSVMSTVTSSMTAGRASFLPVNVMRDMQDYAVRTATLEAAGGGGRMAGAAGGAAKVPGIMGTWLDEAGKAASDIAMAQLNPRGAVGAATGFAAGAAVGDEDTTLADRLRHGAAGAVAGTFLLGANRVRPTGKAQQFLLRGGGAGGADTGWRASERWLRDVQRQGGRPVRSAGEAARYLGDWAGDIASLQGIKGINERAELIARTAAMRRAEDVRGLAPTEAVMAGRDITYDPDRAGRVARAVNGVVPFFNATTQSGAQFIRMFRQHPAAATATMVTTVAPVVAAAEAWNRSDPERARVYDDVPDYVKNTGIVVVTPWAGSDSRGERPNYLWIPTGIITPFVLGMRESMRNVPGLEPRAEGTTPESDAARWADTLNDVLQVFNPVRGDTAGSLASNLVPPIVKQTVELANNRDLYRGTPIMTDVADERASAASKAIASGARAVGRTVGSDFLQEVRPSGVEHLVRSLPAYGDIVTGASDLVAPSGYKQAEDRPVANEPFLGGVGARFIRDTGGQSLQDAEADRLGPTVRAVLEEAELPPSTIGTVSSRWQNGPLTRDEQLAWQEATNAEAERFVPQARRDARWRQPATREAAIQEAMTKAREAGAKRARLPGSSEMERRMRAEEQMRAAG